MTKEKDLVLKRLERLDILLQYFISKKTSDHTRAIFCSAFDINDNTYHELEQTLINDGHISKYGNSAIRTIEGKGIDFWNNGKGGYLKPYKKLKRKEWWDKIHKWGLYVAAMISMATAVWTKIDKTTTEQKLLQQGILLHKLQKQVYQINLRTPTSPSKEK